jgi:GGDEF domain-containing protein
MPTVHPRKTRDNTDMINDPEGERLVTGWNDPWRAHWGAQLRERLSETAAAVERMLGPKAPQLGVLPAVYFTRLRMGSVPFFSWEERAADVRLAFPWNPDYVPPPFTCFAPPLSRSTETWFGLIARVASAVDDFMEGDVDVAHLSAAEELGGLRVGVVSWTDTEPSVMVADEQLLRDSRVQTTTAVFLLPVQRGWLPHVPLLYIQASEPYDTAVAERAILRAAGALPDEAGTATSTEDARAVRRGLLAVARTAHLRAREWLTPKTQLLNRAGFEGLRDDLQWRVARGDGYAELFFDIDEFKKANDTYSYDGADLLAARVTDRVIAFVQREVARAYAQAATMRQATGAPDAVAPDAFRALVAHVSGDEFRLFIRTFAAVETESFEELDPRRFASGVIQCVGDNVPRRTSENLDSRAARHDAALDRSSAARHARTGIASLDESVFAATPTISGGLALLGTMEVSDRRRPSAADLIRARRALTHLDIPAEKAAKRAKEAGRNTYRVAEGDEYIATTPTE